jgi:hypothetical protein
MYLTKPAYAKLFGKGLLAASIAAPSVSASAADDLTINGFLSVGVSIMDTDEIEINDNNNVGRFKENTVFALQVSKPINDMVSITGQLVARGDDNYAMDASWAYMTLSPSDVDSIRVGRLRVPFFNYSDFLEVGYAYNWVSPPSDVYGRLPFSSIDGIDYTRQFEFGDVTGSAQIYYGRFDDEIGNIGGYYPIFHLTDFLGAVVNLNWNEFTFRGSVHRAKLDADVASTRDLVYADVYAGGIYQALNTENPDLGGATLQQVVDMGGMTLADATALVNPLVIPTATAVADEFYLQDDITTFAEMAVTYDNGNDIVVFEYTALEHDSAVLFDDSAWLAMYGRRYNEFTFHATYTVEENSPESGLVGEIQKQALSEPETRTGITVGMRYDFAANTAFKFEIQNREEENFDGSTVDGNLITLAVDMVF